MKCTSLSMIKITFIYHLYPGFTAVTSERFLMWVSITVWHTCEACWSYHIFQIRKTEDKYGHYQYYEIIQTYFKDLNSNILGKETKNQCYDGEETSVTVRECIERFIDSDIGCHIPWHTYKSKGTDAKCSTNDQFHKYVSLSRKLSILDANNMEKTTGCKRRCNRMEFKLSETTPLGIKEKYPPEKTKFSFIFSSGKSIIKKLESESFWSN